MPAPKTTDNPAGPPQAGNMSGGLGGKAMIEAAVALMLGIALGTWSGGRGVWMIAGGGALGGAGVMAWRGRRRAVMCWGLVAVVALGGAWAIQRRDYVRAGTIDPYLRPDGQATLARVVGTVASKPGRVTHDDGPFARFDYRGANTLFELQLERLWVDQAWRVAHGGVLVRVIQPAPGVRQGQRIQARGWLAPIDPPLNPGEANFKAKAARQGITARLTLKEPGNLHAVAGSFPDDNTGGGWGNDLLMRVSQVREWVADQAAASLWIGLDPDEPTTGLLGTVLLGRDSEALGKTRDAFVRVGLAHVLAISGAHLGILMMLVWGLCRLVIVRPGRAGLWLAGVLGLFLLAVPAKVPIVRAAVMAGVFCAGLMIGRRLALGVMLAVAAVGVLVWRPSDLFSVGFELSFGAVAALAWLAAPITQRVWPEPEIRPLVRPAWEPAARWAARTLAISAVVFIVVMPMVAQRFMMVTPLGVGLSVLALPVLAAVLGIGYLKILVGVVLPTGSLLLAGPASLASAVLLTIVKQADQWPGSGWTLAHRPGMAWTLGATAVIVAALAGRFRGRWPALGGAVALVLGWGALTQQPRWAGALGMGQTPWGVMDQDGETALRVDMLAVGDGSCYVVRGGGASGEKTLMFDCGSASFWGVGKEIVVPALARLGVHRIDTLMISHADLDHFVGALDVAEALPIGRVLVPPHVLAEAAGAPDSAVGVLVAGLRQRGLEPRAVTRGWHETWGRGRGAVKLKLLWPLDNPRAMAGARDNDRSLVLSMRTGNPGAAKGAKARRVLLSGDIRDPAMLGLLNRGTDLRADVADLPHHGSFVETSPRWLWAVSPSIALQSCGDDRLRQDPWPPVIRGRELVRLVSAREGAVEVRIAMDGRITWHTFTGAVPLNAPAPATASKPTTPPPRPAPRTPRHTPSPTPQPTAGPSAG